MSDHEPLHPPSLIVFAAAAIVGFIVGVPVGIAIWVAISAIGGGS